LISRSSGSGLIQVWFEQAMARRRRSAIGKIGGWWRGLFRICRCGSKEDPGAQGVALGAIRRDHREV